MSEQRPWLKNYPKGIPANIDADQYQSLVAMFDETFVKYKKLKAFSCMGADLTFEQVDKLSRDFGAYLNSRGLEPGDKIALMMPNLLQYPIDKLDPTCNRHQPFLLQLCKALKNCLWAVL